MNDVCAVVVTFHPDGDVLENLATVRPQVSSLVVVDNGSNPAELAPLRAAAVALAFELIENGDNLGIATALNIGVLRAKALGFGWVLLFDQDSRVTPGFVTAMMHGFSTSSFGDKLAILNPRYIDSRFRTDLEQHRHLATGELESATTSGSLSPMWLYDKVGLFTDELFIDGVDYDFSLRVREFGYVCATCTEAFLLHAPGTPTPRTLFGRFHFKTSNYSAIRRYYQERNKLWNIRRHGRRFPEFFANQMFISVKDLTRVLLAEEDPWTKAKFFLRGWIDGLRGRMGKYPYS